MTFDDCVLCKENYFCPDFGLNEGTISPCPPGYECLGGAIHKSKIDGITMRLCPKGRMCNFDEINNPVASEPCPVNYFNPSKG